MENLHGSEVVTDEVLEGLSFEISGIGARLGRCLKVPNAAIDHIKAEFKDQQEANYQILLKWKQKQGKQATCSVLREALVKIHRTDLAEEYFGDADQSTTKKQPGKTPSRKRETSSKENEPAKKPKKNPTSPKVTPAKGSLDSADNSERMDNLQLYIVDSLHGKPSKLAWTSEKKNITRPLKKNGFINICAHGRWPEDVIDVSINIAVKEGSTREIGTISSTSRALYYDFRDNGLQDVLKSGNLVIKRNYVKEKAALQETSASKRIPNQHSKIRQRSGLTSSARGKGKQDDQQNTSSLLSSSSWKKRSDLETPETGPYKDGGTVPASRRLCLSERVKNPETPPRITRSFSKVSPPADCTEDRPSKRWGHAMCVTGPDTMMVVGGEGAGQVTSKDALWELNSSTTTWSVPEVEQLASRPELRTGHTMTPILNLVYVFGGFKNVRWYNDMFVLDISDKKWSYIDAGGNAPKRAYHTSTFFQGDMFVFGGIHPHPKLDSCSNDLFIFSLESNHWYKPPVLDPKPKPRSGHSATLLGDKLVFFGGWDEPVCFNDVYILDLRKRLMKFSSPVVEGEAPSPRSWHASCALSGNRVLIHGGYDGKNTLSDAFVFSLDTLRWQKVTLKGPVGARAGHTICAIPDGETDKIVMFGGGDNEGNFFNDLLFITAP